MISFPPAYKFYDAFLNDPKLHFKWVTPPKEPPFAIIQNGSFSQIAELFKKQTVHTFVFNQVDGLPLQLVYDNGEWIAEYVVIETDFYMTKARFTLLERRYDFKCLLLDELMEALHLDCALNVLQIRNNQISLNHLSSRERELPLIAQKMILRLIKENYTYSFDQLNGFVFVKVDFANTEKDFLTGKDLSPILICLSHPFKTVKDFDNYFVSNAIPNQFIYRLSSDWKGLTLVVKSNIYSKDFVKYRVYFSEDRGFFDVIQNSTLETITRRAIIHKKSDESLFYTKS